MTSLCGLHACQHVRNACFYILFLSFAMFASLASFSCNSFFFPCVCVYVHCAHQRTIARRRRQGEIEQKLIPELKPMVKSECVHINSHHLSSQFLFISQFSLFFLLDQETIFAHNFPIVFRIIPTPIFPLMRISFE